MSISINSFRRLNWTLEDLNGKVAVETTDRRPGDASSGIDGINIGVKDPGDGSNASIWMSVEEAQSLRDWLVKSLPA